MKISDKALKLIGHKILGDMDNATNQDAPTPATAPTPAAPPLRPKLNLQSAPKPPKALVLPFPRRDDDS